MAATRERRVAKELKDIAMDRDKSGVYAWSVDNVSLEHIKGSILAPPGTPYEGGKFQIDIQIPAEYPFKAPKMRFDTRIWHPNISSQTGAICLDTLGTSWSPVNTIKTALLSVRLLLETPNPKDPQDAQVAKMMSEDPEYCQVMAHDWAVRYANAPRKLPPPAEFKRTKADTKKQQEDDISRQVKIRHAPIEKIHLWKSMGYNCDLINRFVNMGFELDAVVAAFNHVGIERRGGVDYELEDAYIGDITAFLFGEQ